MNVKAILFVIIPFVLMMAITVGMPFYRVKILKKAGNKLIPLVTKNSKWLTFGTWITIYLVLILSFLVDFGKLNFVIPYCAVIGLFITSKESSFRPVNGVYEKLLIVGSDILFFDDIVSLPSDEEASHADNVLVVITKKTGKRLLTFDNANEVSEVKQALQEILKN